MPDENKLVETVEHAAEEFAKMSDDMQRYSYEHGCIRCGYSLALCTCDNEPEPWSTPL